MKLTFPSAVTAANTVEEYGAQATSPTGLFKSNVNNGSLKKNRNGDMNANTGTQSFVIGNLKH